MPTIIVKFAFLRRRRRKKNNSEDPSKKKNNSEVIECWSPSKIFLEDLLGPKLD